MSEIDRVRGRLLPSSTVPERVVAPPPPPRPIVELWPEVNDPPRAEITKVGRWAYAVRIRHGISVCGPYPGVPWHVLGRKRAERKAKRELRRYLAREEQLAMPPTVLRAEDL